MGGQSSSVTMRRGTLARKSMVRAGSSAQVDEETLSMGTSITMLTLVDQSLNDKAQLWRNRYLCTVIFGGAIEGEGSNNPNENTAVAETIATYCFPSTR